MLEYEFSLTCIFPYKDKIFDSVLIREYAVRENPYSRIFYAVYFPESEINYGGNCDMLCQESNCIRYLI